MFRNLILDWSGTLCNDLPPVLETINRILDHHGVEQVSEQGFRDEFQLPFDGFYRERIPHASADELEALYRQFFPLSEKGAEAIPHADDFLRDRQDRGCRLLLLSAATESHFEEQAEELGFRNYFECCYAGVRDKRRVIREILAEQGLEREDTCFIGDMEHDVAAAHHAGITSIAVLTGYDSAAKLERARPDLMVRDLERLNVLFRRFEEANQG